MFSKSIVLLAIAGTTFAAPQPQNAGDIAASLTSEFGSLATGIDINSLTSDLGSLTSFDLGSVSSELAAATSLIGAFSDIPTLPASVQSVLATAIPASELTRADIACSATAASWYNNLPADIKSALTSYGSAVQTWAADHTSLLGNLAGTYTGVNIPTCTGGSGSSGGSAASTSRAGSATGSAAGGSAVSSTNSPGAAPRATAIIGGVAGIVGALGVMIAL